MAEFITQNFVPLLFLALLCFLLTGIPVASRELIQHAERFPLPQHLVRKLRDLTACPVRRDDDGAVHLLVADPSARDDVARGQGETSGGVGGGGRRHGIRQGGGEPGAQPARGPPRVPHGQRERRPPGGSAGRTSRRTRSRARRGPGPP